jgi:hypothetical protein
MFTNTSINLYLLGVEFLASSVLQTNLSFFSSSLKTPKRRIQVVYLTPLILYSTIVTVVLSYLEYSHIYLLRYINLVKHISLSCITFDH